MPKSKHRKKHKVKLKKRRNNIENVRRHYKNLKTAEIENMIKMMQVKNEDMTKALDNIEDGIESEVENKDDNITESISENGED